MKRRMNEYYYKSCDIEKMSSLDKKRYELMNDFGYNFDSNSKRRIDFDMQVIRHKNYDCK